MNNTTDSKPVWSVETNEVVDRYLNADYEKFRHYDRFRFKLQHMVPLLKEGTTVLDLGCAKGELIYFLKENAPSASYVGVDYSQALIERAKKEPRLSGVEFLQADVREINLERQFDVVIISSLLAIFDDPSVILDKIFKHLKPGGTAFIYEPFNPHDYDVVMRFREARAPENGWQAAYNQFSRRSISKILEPLTSEVLWHPFQPSIDIPVDPSKPSSYTLNSKELGRVSVTTTGSLCFVFLVQAKKKS